MLSYTHPTQKKEFAMNQTKLQNVLSAMEKQGVSQLIVSDPAVIFYLTGARIEPGERIAQGVSRFLSGEQVFHAGAKRFGDSVDAFNV